MFCGIYVAAKTQGWKNISHKMPLFLLGKVPLCEIMRDFTFLYYTNIFLARSNSQLSNRWPIIMDLRMRVNFA
jgi:hypothetical protein